MQGIVVASLASCSLCLNCSADAEFIALFFLLLLITIMGKLCQYEWINPEKCNQSRCFCFEVLHQVGISLHSAPLCFAALQFFFSPPRLASHEEKQPLSQILGFVGDKSEKLIQVHLLLSKRLFVVKGCSRGSLIRDGCSSSSCFSLSRRRRRRSNI